MISLGILFLDEIRERYFTVISLCLLAGMDMDQEVRLFLSYCRWIETLAIIKCRDSNSRHEVLAFGIVSFGKMTGYVGHVEAGRYLWMTWVHVSW